MSNLIRFAIVALPLLGTAAAGGSAESPACLPASDSSTSLDLQDRTSHPAVRSTSSARRPGRRMRCWQYGRLVFDTQGITAVERKAPGADVEAIRDGTSIQVFDMQQGLCIVEMRQEG